MKFEDCKSHTFNFAVITAYNNLVRFEHEKTDDYILVKQLRKDSLFLLDPKFDFTTVKKDKPLTIMCEEPFEGYKNKVSEIEYDLEDLFGSLSGKQIRRGISINKRKRITFKETGPSDLYDMKKVFDDWKINKMNDDKVFKMTFNPNRYFRTFALKSMGFNIYERIIYVDSSPYAVVSFDLKGDSAFTLCDITKYFDKKLRFVNDLSECILINCLYDLYKNYGIKTVNQGPDGGIKGLKFFKAQFVHNTRLIYSSALK